MRCSRLAQLAGVDSLRALEGHCRLGTGELACAPCRMRMPGILSRFLCKPSQSCRRRPIDTRGTRVRRCDLIQFPGGDMERPHPWHEAEIS